MKQELGVGTSLLSLCDCLSVSRAGCKRSLSICGLNLFNIILKIIISQFTNQGKKSKCQDALFYKQNNIVLEEKQSNYQFKWQVGKQQIVEFIPQVLQFIPIQNSLLIIGQLLLLSTSIKKIVIKRQMAVNRSERFMYFQNKAKHYSNLKNIRASVDHSPPTATIVKSLRPIPLLRQHSIKNENEQLIERIANISKSKKSQLQTEGSYSRRNKLERPFRQHNKYKSETERAITIDNKELFFRLNNIKPVVGQSSQWEREYYRSICCKKNMSRFSENSQSKAQLLISADKFVPKHLRDFGLSQDLDASIVGKQKVVPIQKLFELPKLQKLQRYKFDFSEFSRLKDQND